ncbi:MAG: hypothetical protein LBS97_06740 [Treponema sp.]|nr:hypothetical protein [Treponema sp.]
MKKVNKIAGGLLAVSAVLLVVLLTACENSTAADPTGIYKPLPGIPGGGSAGAGSAGVPDPTFTGRRFDINNLPSTATWNALGHQHAFPDLFHFANGNKVVTVADWEARRKEISKILQYYEYGVMPPLTEEEGVHIGWVDSNTADCTITVKYDTTGNEWTFTVSTTLSASLATVDNEGASKLPLYFGGGGANWEGGTASYSFSGGAANEGDGSGNVPTLFGIDHTLPGSPSANVSYAWHMSVILSVIEGTPNSKNNNIVEKGFRGYYDPKKVGITGYSRNGKAAECIGAFTESRLGNRLGHVGIGSAGAGGPALERFISMTGYKKDGKYADPLPLGQPGLMEYSDMNGKPYYPIKPANGDKIFPDRADSATWAATTGGTSDNARYILVRGWAPYFDAFVQSPTNASQPGELPLSTNMTTPLVTYQSPHSTWSGVQNLSEGRNETPGWFSVRFREFSDLHYGLDLDHVKGQEGRGKYGLLCTIPFDQHYLSALIAPNGVLFQDGYTQGRNNQESQFGNWLMIDEVYKLYGEAEGDEYKYVFRNGFAQTWGDHGGNTGNEAADRNYHATAVFNGDTDKASGSAASDWMLAKLRAPWFSIDDPIGRYDYYRITWGRPNHPTIAERVASRVEPTLAAYDAWMATNPPSPGVGGTTDIKNGYTVPAGTKKFKAMDWRGLTDTPEEL